LADDIFRFIILFLNFSLIIWDIDILSSKFSSSKCQESLLLIFFKSYIELLIELGFLYILLSKIYYDCNMVFLPDNYIAFTLFIDTMYIFNISMELR
jgi:hypothetical protein